MAEAFIKICRKMLNWEWYDDTNTFRLFMHCLLRANWKAGSWHGIDYDAGEFITSLPTLAAETHLSIRQVRVALDHLKMTGELTDRRQGNARIITVVKWNEYQTHDRPDDIPVTDERQTNDRPMTADKEYKEYKEKEEGKEIKNTKEPKHKYGEYNHVMLTDRERDRLMNDYGEAETLAAIKFLDEYIQEKGYKSKDHNLAMRRWVFDAVGRDKKPQNKRSLADKWGVIL